MSVVSVTNIRYVYAINIDFVLHIFVYYIGWYWKHYQYRVLSDIQLFLRLVWEVGSGEQGRGSS